MNYLNRDLPTSYRSESLLDEQPQEEGIMGIDVGYPSNDLMAKVSAQDLARYSQQGDLTRATDYETAMDYLGRMTLLASPDGRWASAARVNLAEAKIEAGDTKAAIKLLREDRSPQRFGSRFRAQQMGSESMPKTPGAQVEDKTTRSPSE